MPKGYIIGHITVRDPEAYKEYIEKDTPILHSLGGQFIVRGGQCEVPEGETYERHVVIEFPTYEEALSAYHDPDYQVVADIRRRTADSTIIVVEGAPLVRFLRRRTLGEMNHTYRLYKLFHKASKRARFRGC